MMMVLVTIILENPSTLCTLLWVELIILKSIKAIIFGTDQILEKGEKMKQELYHISNFFLRAVFFTNLQQGTYK